MGVFYDKPPLVRFEPGNIPIHKPMMSHFTHALLRNSHYRKFAMLTFRRNFSQCVLCANCIGNNNETHEVHSFKIAESSLLSPANKLLNKLIGCKFHIFPVYWSVVRRNSPTEVENSHTLLLWGNMLAVFYVKFFTGAQHPLWVIIPTPGQNHGKITDDNIRCNFANKNWLVTIFDYLKRWWLCSVTHR